MVVAGGASAISGVLLLSVAAFGLGNNVSWFNCCVEPFLGGIIPAFNVQSIDGFVVRLVTGTSRLADWDPMSVPMVYRIVRQVLFAAILGASPCCVAAPAAASRRAEPASNASARCSNSRSSSLSRSSSARSHGRTTTRCCCCPGGSISAGGCLGPSIILTRRLLCSSMVLCSLPVVVLPLQADLVGEIAARTLVSACFVGGVAMLVALMRQLPAIVI